MTEATPAVDQQGGVGLRDHLGQGVRDVYPVNGLLHVLGDSDHAVRRVAREIGVDQPAGDPTRDILRCAGRFQNLGRCPAERLGSKSKHDAPGPPPMRAAQHRPARPAWYAALRAAPTCPRGRGCGASRPRRSRPGGAYAAPPSARRTISPRLSPTWSAAARKRRPGCIRQLDGLVAQRVARASLHVAGHLHLAETLGRSRITHVPKFGAYRLQRRLCVAEGARVDRQRERARSRALRSAPPTRPGSPPESRP